MWRFKRQSFTTDTQVLEIDLLSSSLRLTRCHGAEETASHPKDLSPGRRWWRVGGGETPNLTHKASSGSELRGASEHQESVAKSKRGSSTLYTNRRPTPSCSPLPPSLPPSFTPSLYTSCSRLLRHGYGRSTKINSPPMGVLSFSTSARPFGVHVRLPMHFITGEYCFFC